jgi:hypothetical protein
MNKKKYLKTLIEQCNKVIPLVTRKTYLCTITDRKNLGSDLLDYRRAINAEELNKVIGECAALDHTDYWLAPVWDNECKNGTPEFKATRIWLLKEIKKQAQQLNNIS